MRDFRPGSHARGDAEVVYHGAMRHRPAPVSSLLSALGLAVLSPACEEGSQPEPILDPADPEEGARWDNLTLTFPGAPPNFYDVWGRSPVDVWTCGEAGTVYHFDGAGWTPHDTGVDVALRSISGEVLAEDDPAFPGPLYAVGEGGTIVRYEAGVWSVEAFPPRFAADGVTPLAPVDLNGVAAAAGGRALAVGNEGTILLRDPEAGWSQMDSGTVESLHAVIVSRDASEGVAVGNLGLIVRLRGGAWSRQRVDGLTVPLQTLWGESATYFYAAGLDGTILRAGEGDSIFRVEGAPQVYLRDAWGTSMENVWFVGWGGTIVHTDGITAEAAGEFSDHRLEGVWGVSVPPPPDAPADPPPQPHDEFFLVGVSGTVLVGP